MYNFIFDLFGRTCLRLNPEQITLTLNFFGWKFYPIPARPKQSVTKLVYIPQHLTKGGRDQTTSLVPATLDIWVGVEKYQLHGVKSEAELEWLAHELSDWLGIEIERK